MLYFCTVKSKTTIMKKIDYINKFGTHVYEATEHTKTLYPKYPESPVKPRLLTIKSTPAEHREYANQLEKYNELMVTFRHEKDEHRKIVSEIDNELIEYIKEVSGLNTIPEKFREKVWNKAYEDGHAYGYSEIYNHLIDLVDIFN